MSVFNKLMLSRKGYTLNLSRQEQMDRVKHPKTKPRAAFQYEQVLISENFFRRHGRRQ
jgi:hypothetical protein